MDKAAERAAQLDTILLELKNQLSSLKQKAPLYKNSSDVKSALQVIYTSVFQWDSLLSHSAWGLGSAACGYYYTFSYTIQSIHNHSIRHTYMYHFTFKFEKVLPFSLKKSS